ncbi:MULTISPECIES: NnrS family protein [unclassified Wenzhouxiangella]|uniref:NnrS family protein n=1 Tax=unclassified Wenzhouxiangella TaxID=2613841 RepID=UPI000E329EC5|nr:MULTISPECIES: NnrS family protein [unclassified Wenzhouxiangella]RFF27363.1 NnrS family protein [Wenzhouxiangella sp. 15181]RFP68791.1 NnrS family protein [Wenzhouxiangella sp. 15190]
MPDSSHVQSGPAAGSTRVVTETRLFPLAALYGALSVPAFVLGWTGLLPTLPGLRTPAGHAHELLFGYALAVVAGFLINRVSAPRLALMMVLWLGARLAFLFMPGSLPAIALNLGFAALVAATAAPRFMKAAKKWRNRLTGPLVLAICAAAAGFQLLSFHGGGLLSYLLLGEAVVLFAMLMLFFGGRLIAPAAAGVIEGAGGTLTARVQPNIEGAILLAMIAAAGTAFIPAAGPVHGLLLVVTGTLALVRLGRWQLWLCRRRADLLCLGVGYAWLGIGLLLLGAERGFGIGLPANAATHAITVGALGTLTTSVMLRTRLLRLRIPLDQVGGYFAVMTVLVSLAALARLLGGASHAGLLLAAVAWSSALLVLFALLQRFRQRVQPG